MVSECKKRCNETCSCLCHDCVNCKEILCEDEGEIEFDSDDEEELTVVQIDVLIHLKVYYYFFYCLLMVSEKEKDFQDVKMQWQQNISINNFFI